MTFTRAVRHRKVCSLKCVTVILRLYNSLDCKYCAFFNFKKKICQWKHLFTKKKRNITYTKTSCIINIYIYINLSYKQRDKLVLSLLSTWKLVSIIERRAIRKSNNRLSIPGVAFYFISWHYIMNSWFCCTHTHTHRVDEISLPTQH